MLLLISGSLSDQHGIMIGNQFKRHSVRINIDHKVNDRLGFGVNYGLSRTNNGRLPADNLFNTPLQLVALAPITPVRDLDGNLYDRPTTTYYNGLVDFEEGRFNTKVFRNLANLYATYEVTPGLTLRSDFGLDLLTQYEDQFFGSKTISGQGIGGYGTSRWVQITNYTSSTFLTYNKSIANAHNFTFTGGIEFQKSDRDQTNVAGQGFPLDDLKKLASASEITDGNSTLSQFSFVSYFGRVNYILQDKYLVGLSGRVDGSSRFGVNNRYGFFPSASAGWILSKEGFLENNSVISFLKVRASYGLLGNAGIPNYASFGLYGSATYANSAGLAPTRIPNPDLTWETTAQTDIGIDFGFLGDRITGEIDYYNKLTTDLLLDTPVPGTTGFSAQFRNVGELRNRGVEVVLNTNNIVGTFKWSTSFNIARNRNEVLKLDGDQDIIDLSDSRWLNVVKVGESIGVFYGREFAGADPENGDGLWYINDPENPGDRSTTNDFNEANQVVLGDPNPKFIGGITNTFSYKGIDLSFLFQFVQGNQIFNGGGGFMSASVDWFDNQTKDQLKRWQQPGDITNVPQARLGYGNGIEASSRYISDGSYVRLRNISIGYAIPIHLVSKVSLRTARVFITAQNLLTFTKYDGWDPEVNTDYRDSNINQGNDFYSAPQPKTITFGINLGF
jgi:TonB-dependent starch-binding outer membrane protein SusC